MIDDDNIIGEGEIKIMNHIHKSHLVNHFVVSNDSDILLQSLLLEDKDIYVIE